MSDSKLVTFEYPGIIVVNGAHEGGDVGIDRDGDEWRVCVYAHNWTQLEPMQFADDGDPIAMLTQRVQDEDGDLGEIANFKVEEGVGNPDDGDVLIVLPDDVTVFINRTHVFVYWCNDGGACTGIAHRSADRSECESLGCGVYDGETADGVRAVN